MLVKTSDENGCTVIMNMCPGTTQAPDESIAGTGGEQYAGGNGEECA